MVVLGPFSLQVNSVGGVSSFVIERSCRLLRVAGAARLPLSPRRAMIPAASILGATTPVLAPVAEQVPGVVATAAAASREAGGAKRHVDVLFSTLPRLCGFIKGNADPSFFAPNDVTMLLAISLHRS